jgi:hypothetical protein
MIFGVYDRLTDHGHCVADVVLAPAKADGEPDWENTGPANVSSLPADEWPQGDQAEKRACVLVSDIDGCDPDSTFIVILHHETGIPGMFQIHGPEIDRIVADSIIGRDLGNRPAAPPPSKLAEGLATLREELFPPKPGPTAANDNKPSSSPPAAKPPYFLASASELLDKQFPPIKFIVPGAITEGLTILGGRPKLGKSWLAANICLAVATGGLALGQECARGDALYLALEDNERRLKDRFLKLMPPLKSLRPDISRLAYTTAAPRMNAGLIEFLDEWRKSVDDPRLVVIDTLAMVRPPKGRNQGDYEADYAALSPLQKYAGEHRLGIIVVTHVRKAEAVDPLEMISGTNGLTGAADSIMVLNRDADGPKLYGRGRDIEELEKALKFDAGRWSVLGDADDVKRSDQRRKIIAALEESRLPMKPGEIATATSLKGENVRYLLRKMVEAGEIEKLAYGTYRLAPAA